MQSQSIFTCNKCSLFVIISQMCSKPFKKATMCFVEQTPFSGLGDRTDIYEEHENSRWVDTRKRHERKSAHTLALSMPACSDVNEAMQEVTGNRYTTSDQHVESSEPRQKEDDKDMRSLLSFLIPRNPFSCDESLRSISTGAIVDKQVNADKSREVGGAILNKMRNVKVKDFSFKKKDQIVTMNTKASPVCTGPQVDPQLLFQHLVAAAQAESKPNLPDLFKYDLTCPPAALFGTCGLLREAAISQLADALVTEAARHGTQPTMEVRNPVYVMDGGSLLRKLPWKRGDSFARIATTHVEYVSRRYSQAHQLVVVFDGYGNGPSTKDVTHARRSACLVGPSIRFAPKKYANTHTTIVLGEDTDLLVLLLVHAELNGKPVLLRSDRKGKKHPELNILWLKAQLGPECCRLLPFLHAINGCDTTSRLFGIGKGLPLKKVMTESALKDAVEIFSKAEQIQEDIIKAGEKALVCLYNGQADDNLDFLRYRRFCEKVTSCLTTVPVQSLPPSSGAGKYHSLRVYLQVQRWLHFNCDLKPEDWGWNLSSQHVYEPRTTDLAPAPPHLMKGIRCKSKTDRFKGGRCACRTLGLECTLACVTCRGLTCTNSPPVEPLQEVPEELADLC